METKPTRIFRIALLLCLLLQEKCIKKCLEEHKPSKRPTGPGELADEENDPRRPRPSGLSPRPPRPSGVSPRPPRPSGVGHRPSHEPLLVRLVCFITI